MILTVHDITDESQRERELRIKSAMIQEIHHRVKNNLQVISSLINIQQRKLEPGSARHALQECQTRVQAIALIHDKLYQSRDYSRVPFSQYAKGLVTNIFHATGSSPGVNLEIEAGEVALAVDKAIPCGLILNELLTNALLVTVKMVSAALNERVPGLPLIGLFGGGGFVVP